MCEVFVCEVYVCEVYVCEVFVCEVYVCEVYVCVCTHRFNDIFSRSSDVRWENYFSI